MVNLQQCTQEQMSLLLAHSPECAVGLSLQELDEPR